MQYARQFTLQKILKAIILDKDTKCKKAICLSEDLPKKIQYARQLALLKIQYARLSSLQRYSQVICLDKDTILKAISPDTICKAIHLAEDTDDYSSCQQYNTQGNLPY